MFYTLTWAHLVKFYPQQISGVQIRCTNFFLTITFHGVVTLPTNFGE